MSDEYHKGWLKSELRKSGRIIDEQQTEIERLTDEIRQKDEALSAIANLVKNEEYLTPHDCKLLWGLACRGLEPASDRPTNTERERALQQTN